MLGVDHQRAGIGTIEPGADSGVFEGSGEVGFKGQNREEVYGWVDQMLRQQRYEELKRSDRGLVRRYVEKMTGLSRAQTTRLITVYLRGDEVKPQPYRRCRFPRRYTRVDIALLAGVDAAHETLSGPATKKLLQRACYNFNDRPFQSLARISVAHLYRLRSSRAYRERRIQYQAPRPEGRSPPVGRHRNSKISRKENLAAGRFAPASRLIL